LKPDSNPLIPLLLQKQSAGPNKERESLLALQEKKHTESTPKNCVNIENKIGEDDDIILEEVAILGKTEDDSEEEDEQDAFEGTKVNWIIFTINVS